MLAERGIITQRELQDMLGVQSGSLSEILNKVETCGYIMRRQNERDRRQMNLELTALTPYRSVCVQRMLTRL